VRNIAVSHTFKIEKAQRELGFSPKRYSLTDSVDHLVISEHMVPLPAAPDGIHCPHDLLCRTGIISLKGNPRY
ncbi:hypothetical protein M9458_053604, partial [Cirrhinus mrigala]